MSNSFNKQEEPIPGQEGLPADAGTGGGSAKTQDPQLPLGEWLTKAADQLAQDGKKQREQLEKEIVTFRDGTTVNIAHLMADAAAHRQPYEAIFPNSNPFFKEIFRLMGLDEADASKYIKPGVVGRHLVYLIYLRFSQGESLVTYLRSRAVPNGIRTAKFFQFLNPAGIEKAKQFRDEAIDMMKRYGPNEWYSFYRAFGKRHGIPVQLNAFEESAA
ncbi:P63C domain-containing protein [Chitinophaga rhizosphaerae]|uniref:P63C domain-containing protein n=1 Tax=Chitinophaga rhizosphaerae TaxID=1864947 RepID=UPI000F8036D9|nr:P63C domain-containing protein [Chitinophaga rhizosphaerae]